MQVNSKSWELEWTRANCKTLYSKFLVFVREPCFWLSFLVRNIRSRTLDEIAKSKIMVRLNIHSKRWGKESRYCDYTPVSTLHTMSTESLFGFKLWEVKDKQFWPLRCTRCLKRLALATSPDRIIQLKPDDQASDAVWEVGEKIFYSKGLLVARGSKQLWESRERIAEEYLRYGRTTILPMYIVWPLYLTLPNFYWQRKGTFNQTYTDTVETNAFMSGAHIFENFKLNDAGWCSSKPCLHNIGFWWKWKTFVVFVVFI